MTHYYTKVCANIYRGVYSKSREATREYNECKKKIAEMINAGSEKEIIFTSGATHSINLAKNLLINSNIILPGQTILISQLEHHSNMIPWMELISKGISVEAVTIDSGSNLDMEDAAEKIRKRPALIAITHASNVTGELVHLEEVSRMSRENNSILLVDAAQSISHQFVDVKRLGIDMLAFSSHKMLGPTGLGVLYVKEALLKKLRPFFFGGGTVKSVTLNDNYQLLDYPEVFEPGTPNIGAVYGLKEAADFICNIGYKDISEYEEQLCKYMLDKTGGLRKVKIYGSEDTKYRIPTFSFSVDGFSPEEVAMILSEKFNIAVRSGMHCAQPAVEAMDRNGLIRASLTFYNTFDEIDYFINAINTICEEF